MASSRNVIINVALGGWYPKGQKRLVDSLIELGWSSLDLRLWAESWPNDNYDKTCPYNCKAAALEEVAHKMVPRFDGHLWLDASFWAVRHPQPVFDIINTDGYYFVNNGFNCAETVSDKCLEYFGVSRDDAENMPECASGIMGISMKHFPGRQFLQEFIQACKDGAAHGSRLHDNQSKDPRFKFHRQDQSVASMIINKMGLKMHPWGAHVEYNPKDVKEHTVFTLQGM
jgi:hypothetical protein